MSHDWKARLAEPFYFSQSETFRRDRDRFGPFSFETQGGDPFTAIGSLFATLVVSGEHAPRLSLSDRVPLGAERRPSSKLSPLAIHNVVSKATSLPVAGSLDVAGLRQLCGEHLPPHVETSGECPECKGDGEVTCFYCEHEHECERCDGTGKISDSVPEDAPEAYVTIGGSVLDSLILRPLLRLVPDGAATVRLGKGMVALAGPDWTLVVACVVRDGGPPVVDAIPAVEIVPLRPEVPA